VYERLLYILPTHVFIILYSVRLEYYFFFFFQAEDGIRDRNVTGVQTCALPISTRISDVIASGLDQYDAVFVPGGHGPMIDLLDRSEERRVGKECRSWWSP